MVNNISSQDTKQQLDFLGIPIEGSLCDFISQMECNNFSLIEKGTEAAIMEGYFFNYQCTVHIDTFDENGIVCKIVVFIDENSSNKESFRGLSRNITTEYGCQSQEWQSNSDHEYANGINWILDYGKISVHSDNDHKTIFVDFESKMV
jgi:hypothetical protein